MKPFFSFLSVGFFIFFSPKIAALDTQKTTVKLIEKDACAISMDTCFSPQQICAPKLVSFINCAQKTLDIAIYDINEKSIVDAIISKAAQTPAIAVRLVCDKSQSTTVTSKISYLVQNGVKVKYGKQAGIMHDKFVIVDGKMLETGSFNYTHHANLSNHENQIYLSDPTTVSSYVNQFAQIWATAE